MQPRNKWYRIKNEDEVFSPSLIIFTERVEENIRRMIQISGDVKMLRPHVKTHKMSEIVRLQIKHGISKFKCATIAEAEMVAECMASDILLAMQPVGPNIERFFRLKSAFLNTNFSCIADSEPVIKQLSESAQRFNVETEIWLDINAGMNRTGIVPGEEAFRMYKMISSLPKLKAGGLHVYDGHIHEKKFELRQQICNQAFVPVQKLINDLNKAGYSPVKVVAGGSPTFPIHASRKNVETTPGTILLWDYGYSSSFSDMDFLHAAVLFSRVVSKPAMDIICLDLGHKAVGSEMPQPRVRILDFDDYEIIGHNEEHMVIRTSHSVNLNTGDPVYSIPWHICPTVDRFDTVYTAIGSHVSGQWNVEARKRQITY
jgi:D-serine deaminase-like pyridoxal phosphate-dependent protein